MKKLYIVYYQRYPQDAVSERHFTNKAAAISVYDHKNDDYSYTVRIADFAASGNEQYTP